jgi:hypothetical protein
MKIYKIADNYYLDHVLEFPDSEDGIPYGYTRKAPPDLPETEGIEYYTKWNGAEWEHTQTPPPEPPPVVEPPKIISKLDFLDRLGDDEYIAILTASKTDVQVEAWINKFNLSGDVNLSDTKTQSALAMLVSKSLITQEKADSLLA